MNDQELDLQKVLESLGIAIPEGSDDNSIDVETVVEEDVEETRTSQPLRAVNATKRGLYIASIRDAREQLDMHLHMVGKQFGLQVAEYILDDANTVYGTSDEYHNLICVYLRDGDYFNALRISEYALIRFPASADLLANAIRAASSQGDFETAARYIFNAKSVPTKFWTWRLFVFAIDAYKDMMKQCPPDQINQYHAEAIELAKAYQQTMPMDERGYNQEAELLLMFNDVAGARKLLENLLNQGIDVNGIYRHLVAPNAA